MAASLTALRKRLAKVNQQVAEKARREKLVNCNCQLVTLALSDGAEKFESEMNLPCPRALGIIVRLQLVSPRPETPTSGTLMKKRGIYTRKASSGMM